MNNLGKYLKKVREDLNLSLRQADKLTGISRSYLSQLERGAHEPQFRTLQKLAKFYNVPLMNFFKEAGYLDHEDE